MGTVARNGYPERVFRHEFGHHVDYREGDPAKLKALSEGPGFKDVMIGEYSEIMGDKQRLERLKAEVANWKGKWNANAAVSDLFGAVTNEDIVGVWKHGKPYYRRRGVGGRTKQAFANLIDIYGSGDQEMIDYIEKELPKLTKAFKEIIGGL
jgi:hypothetical protein